MKTQWTIAQLERTTATQIEAQKAPVTMAGLPWPQVA
jgi:hypothetical protein